MKTTASIFYMFSEKDLRQIELMKRLDQQARSLNSKFYLDENGKLHLIEKKVFNKLEVN